MSKPVNEKLINLGIILWISFVSAGIATTLFFASFDPVSIAEVATFKINIDRITGYSLGFLLFWLLLVCNCLLVNGLSRRRNF